MMGVLCGLVFTGTCMVTGICGVIVFGKIGLPPAWLPPAYLREYTGCLRSWLNHDGLKCK